MHLVTVLDLLARPDDPVALRDFGAPAWLWVAFGAGVVALLLLDLFVFHRTAHEISMREATITSAGWIALGLGFGGVVWWVLGSTAAAQYFTGYVVEKSLSVDNVFVWAVIFGYFAIPKAYQHRVLFWGIFGALFLRVVFVLAGVALLERLAWILYVFGAFLILTAVRVARHSVSDFDPERNLVLRAIRAVIPVTARLDGQRLFTRVDGHRMATPLFATLVVVEATDVLFAVDSVPAILAISRDPFIVISSNAMAILGLRALYFLLAGAQDRLVYLNRGLGVILAFVGVKMIISRQVHIPAVIALGVIALVLVVTVVASLRAPADAATEGRRLPAS